MITASVMQELRTNNKKTFWKSIRHVTNNIINFLIHSVFYLSILLQQTPTDKPWIWNSIILLLQREQQASWASHICVQKERIIWIIWMPYTSFISMKFFFPWSNHLFLYKKVPPSSFSFWLFKRIDFLYWFLFPEAIFQATNFNSIRVH